MNIGVVGSGTVGTILTQTFSRGENTIVLSHQGGAASLTPRRAEFAANVTFGEVAVALQQPLVIIAVPFTVAPTVLSQVADYQQRIVVDVTNQFTADFKKIDTRPLTSSEVIAQAAHNARVIKAFNTLPHELMTGHVDGPGQRVLFYAGDDRPAKKQFAELVKPLNFHPVNLGKLRHGGSVMQVGGGLGHTAFVQLDESLD
ncbi:MAG: NAD(P)-binding domain-containing protein [Levilactobacillus sp.]|jgi:predicted dinucleotide-binding enzyme|uniref:NADPH-dependent F420 reductase n=1 Tax=Levilactobacillus sp. TaxID=2767919 RepID=UPI0025885F99|nr:NAD(P)-binding domain-containing protein [Levilactobacillus sp.]MCI1554307.1 NAD(P)-binding domain-containing protein [Levilactobacillus sp.]MCI1598584.1 NAD(P)-binding domain-containing protein [Levilactobacillus sp.]MCI1606264.1 NAD(P)-binding domain-containing protein [Levilactobacillus sp.]